MKKKVVVIEDEPQMRKNLASILKLENFEPITADDGAVGLERIREHRPELILCDINLPSMDGFTVLKHVRCNADTSLTPFIFLTAKGEKSDQRLGMTLGADDYLSKPFAPDDLMRSINSILSKQMAWHAETRNKIDYKSHFVTCITQDLRSPLAVLLLNLDSLQFDQVAAPEEDRQELMREMRCQITQMNRMIEDILMYGRMESGTHPRQRVPVDVLEIARRVIRDTAVVDGGEHLFELCDGPLTADIALDPVLTRQIISNLLANASKLSPSNTTIIIKIRSDGQHLLIQVTDQGTGITLDELERVFHPFPRTVNASQQRSTGYGLFIVKSYVEWLGGTITVQSVPHQGSTFTVRLPSTSD